MEWMNGIIWILLGRSQQMRNRSRSFIDEAQLFIFFQNIQWKKTDGNINVGERSRKE